MGTSGCSLVDSVLVSEDLMNRFNEPNPNSDHCVIEFSLNLCNATILGEIVAKIVLNLIVNINGIKQNVTNLKRI